MNQLRRRRVVFLGTPQAAIPALDALIEIADVPLVLTQPDRPRRRSSKPVPTPVKVRAEHLGIAVGQPEHPGDISEMIGDVGPIDVAVLVAFGQLVRLAALEIPRRGFLNLHFSVLPTWRGAAPVQRAIMAGDERTGVSLMVLDQGLDTGPVVASYSTKIDRYETGGDLLDRLAVAGATLLVSQLVPYLEGRVTAVPQPSGATIAAKIGTHDRRIDWSRSAVECARQIMALSPLPGANTIYNGAPFKVLSAYPIAGSDQMARLGFDTGVTVGTGAGLVRLVSVQPSGRTAMSAEDWVRGLADGPIHFE